MFQKNQFWHKFLRQQVTTMIVHRAFPYLYPLKNNLLQLGRYTITEISNELFFTHKFYDALEQKLENKKPDSFLRLQINTGEGCEGFTYKFKFDNLLNKENDYVKSQTWAGKDGEKERVIFAINREQIKLLKGATLDYVEQMMRQIFFVKQNPNAEVECSCKVSFSPKQGLL